MRWDNLFDDLEGQLEQELIAEEIDLRAEEARLRLGRLSLRDRLAALARRAGGDPVEIVRVVLVSGRPLTIRPHTFGKDWLAADLVGPAEGAARAPEQCVLPLAAIGSIVLRPEDAERCLDAEPERATRIADRIGLPFVLRDLCRRRKALEVHTSSGDLHGTVDRVGRDHVDLAVHPPGTVRRVQEVSQVRIVPVAGIHLLLLR